MIMVDPRAGSGHLLAPIRSLGVEVELVELPFADIAFIGVGPDSRPVPVGIEVKKLGDLLACIGNGRFSGHQLPGLLGDYESVWLLVEGLWRPDATGVLETPMHGGWRPLQYGNRRWMYREVDNFLLTLTLKAGVRVIRTGSSRETAQSLVDLYKWWTVKGWDGHKSHLAIHQIAPPTALLRKPSLMRVLASNLPNVGWERSLAVERHFASIRAMVAAGAKEWAKVEGIGKGIAGKLDKLFDGKGEA